MAKRIRLTPKALNRIRKKKPGAKEPTGKKESAASQSDYAVGRGKPPLHTRFKKGDGRKRPGRTPGSKNLRTIIMEAVSDPVTVTIEGKSRKITKLQASAMQLATKAATGNDKAIAQLLDWVDQIEAQAAAARPSEYPISETDLGIIRAVHSRLRPWGSRADD